MINIMSLTGVTIVVKKMVLALAFFEQSLKTEGEDYAFAAVEAVYFEGPTHNYCIG